MRGWKARKQKLVSIKKVKAGIQETTGEARVQGSHNCTKDIHGLHGTDPPSASDLPRHYNFGCRKKIGKRYCGQRRVAALQGTHQEVGEVGT